MVSGTCRLRYSGGAVVGVALQPRETMPSRPSGADLEQRIHCLVASVQGASPPLLLEYSEPAADPAVSAEVARHVQVLEKRLAEQLAAELRAAEDRHQVELRAAAVALTTEVLADDEAARVDACERADRAEAQLAAAEAATRESNERAAAADRALTVVEKQLVSARREAAALRGRIGLAEEEAQRARREVETLTLALTRARSHADALGEQLAASAGVQAVGPRLLLLAIASPFH